MCRRLAPAHHCPLSQKDLSGDLTQVRAGSICKVLASQWLLTCLEQYSVVTWLENVGSGDQHLIQFLDGACVM